MKLFLKDTMWNCMKHFSEINEYVYNYISRVHSFRNFIN